MNIHRSYPRRGFFARLLSHLRFPHRRIKDPPPEPSLDVHLPPLPPRLVIVGLPPGAWRKAVLTAREHSPTMGVAIQMAFFDLGTQAPTARFQWLKEERKRPLAPGASVSILAPAPPIFTPPKRFTRVLIPNENELELRGILEDFPTQRVPLWRTPVSY